MVNNQRDEQGIDAASGKDEALIIDDSKIVQALLRRFLEPHGYSCLSALTGNEGMEIYKRRKPKLTFLDIVLPNVSGLNILSDIKKSDPNAIVIVISSFVSMENVKNAKDQGADWFLKKPIEQDKVAELVKRFKS